MNVVMQKRMRRHRGGMGGSRHRRCRHFGIFRSTKTRAGVEEGESASSARRHADAEGDVSDGDNGDQYPGNDADDANRGRRLSFMRCKLANVRRSRKSPHRIAEKAAQLSGFIKLCRGFKAAKRHWTCRTF
jgi:hypothetical protein